MDDEERISPIERMLCYMDGGHSYVPVEPEGAGLHDLSLYTTEECTECGHRVTR